MHIPTVFPIFAEFLEDSYLHFLLNRIPFFFTFILHIALWAHVVFRSESQGKIQRGMEYSGADCYFSGREDTVESIREKAGGARFHNFLQYSCIYQGSMVRLWRQLVYQFITWKINLCASFSTHSALQLQIEGNSCNRASRRSFVSLDFWVPHSSKDQNFPHFHVCPVLFRAFTWLIFFHFFQLINGSTA